jgi:PRTRC genetic system protein A
MFDVPLYMYKRGQALPRPERLYDYVIAAQGVVKRVETRYSSVDVLVAPLDQQLTGLGLQPYPLQPLRLKVPRIPESLLLLALADARSHLPREAMYHFRFEAATGWRITQPPQDQTWARVGYHNDDPAGIVLDLHSHHTLPAFFSATDDSDEKEGRFYAVIGRLDLPHPELILRLGLYGHWLSNVPAVSLFEGLGPLVETHLDDAQTYESSPPVLSSPGWLDRLLGRLK